MNRALTHALLGLAWSAWATVFLLAVALSLPGPSTGWWWAQVWGLLLVWWAGYGVLQWSWLRGDAPARPRPRWMVPVFTALSLGTSGLALAPYLLITRGWARGGLASLLWLGWLCLWAYAAGAGLHLMDY